jgi:hypothetical protein
LALSSKGSFEDVSARALFKSGARASSRSSTSSSNCSRRDKTFEESIAPLLCGRSVRWSFQRRNIKKLALRVNFFDIAARLLRTVRRVQGCRLHAFCRGHRRKMSILLQPNPTTISEFAIIDVLHFLPSLYNISSTSSSSSSSSSLAILVFHHLEISFPVQQPDHPRAYTIQSSNRLLIFTSLYDSFSVSAYMFT